MFNLVCACHIPCPNYYAQWGTIETPSFIDHSDGEPDKISIGDDMAEDQSVFIN